MFDGKYDIKYFLTSKTLKLKESYKDWKRISHVYLADKISQRDPGNTQFTISLFSLFCLDFV